MALPTTVNTTTSAAILKTLWPQERVENTVYEDNPLLAMLPKSEKFHGANMVLAVRYADTQGRSAAFATAQALKGAYAAAKFTLTRTKNYQLFTLDTESILAAENDRGALISNLDTEISSAMNNIGRSQAINLYQDGSGVRGRRSSASTNVITLTDVNDVTNFEVNMTVQAAATKTGAIRSGDTYITAIDRDAGTITLNSAAAITSFADNDYLFAKGDSANNGGTPLALMGLLGWLPTTAPTSGDSFFSLDRSVDATRLAGLRIDVSGLNPEEGWVTVLSKLSREGGSPDYGFMNHAKYRDIEISLGSKVQYEDLSVGEIGFRAMRINGPKKPCKVVADQNCPSSYGFALTMKHWKLYSMGKLFRILDLDGDKLSREGSSDGWEGRIVSFAQVGCTFPGANAVVTLP